MIIGKIGSIGFTKIFTSDHPDLSSDDNPEKIPYLVFVLPETKLNYAYLRDKGYSRLGTIDSRDNQYILTITSDRKVMRAMEIFLKETKTYPNKDNQIAIGELNTYYETCKKRQEHKPTKAVPNKSKRDSKFLKVDSVRLPQTANVTYLVKNQNKPQKQYIYKKNVSGRQISEVEAFNAYCYRLLLGDRHPKVKSVHGPQGERAGLVSEKLTQFKSLHDYEKEKGKFPTEQEMIDGEIGKLYAAAYVEEENDLHGGNYSADGKKIDDDQSTWPLTSKYAGVDPKRGGGYAPVNAFRVTQRDIESFPVLTDAQPRNWPDRSDGNRINVKKFVNNKQFIHDKYYILLKRILIPDEVYQAIGATISSDKTREKFVDHKCNKTKELKKVLLNTPQFQDYIIANPGIIEQIKANFTEYNKKEGDMSLCVDLKRIEESFNSINHEVYKKKGLPGPLKDQVKIDQENLLPNSHDSDSSEIRANTTLLNNQSNYIDDVIKFLSDNLDFFVVLFEERKGFYELAKNITDTIKPLSDGLRSVLPTLDEQQYFYKLLTGGDTKKIGFFLKRNLNLTNYLKEHMTDPIIIHRQTDKFQKDQKSGSLEASKQASMLSGSIFNHQRKDINDVVRFISEKIDFYKSLFEKRESFYELKKINTDALKPLAEELRTVLPNIEQQHYFYNILDRGDTKKIGFFLKRNPDLTRLLKRHMTDPDINEWSKDKLDSNLREFN